MIALTETKSQNLESFVDRDIDHALRACGAIFAKATKAAVQGDKDAFFRALGSAESEKAIERIASNIASSQHYRDSFVNNIKMRVSTAQTNSSALVDRSPASGGSQTEQDTLWEWAPVLLAIAITALLSYYAPGVLKWVFLIVGILYIAHLVKTSTPNGRAMKLLKESLDNFTI